MNKFPQTIWCIKEGWYSDRNERKRHIVQKLSEFVSSTFIQKEFHQWNSLCQDSYLLPCMYSVSSKITCVLPSLLPAVAFISDEVVTLIVMMHRHMHLFYVVAMMMHGYLYRNRMMHRNFNDLRVRHMHRISNGNWNRWPSSEDGRRCSQLQQHMATHCNLDTAWCNKECDAKHLNIEESWRKLHDCWIDDDVGFFFEKPHCLL